MRDGRSRETRQAGATPLEGVLRSILSVPEFQAVLRRERNRSDRSRLPFSIALFDVGERADQTDIARALVVMLRQRLRSTDELGWVDRRRIGAVLPYTDAAGGGELLRAVAAQLERAGLAVATSLQTYPTVPTAAARPSDERHDPPSDGAPTQEPPAAASFRLPDAAAAPLRDAATPALVPELLILPLPRWKRAMDIVGSAVALLLLAPVIGLAALAINLDSSGPVFYRQRRVGAGGRPFDFFKLRTMRNGAHEEKFELWEHNEQSGPVFKMRSDPRITRVGRFLRRSSIDELPQFWNVLKGDMSLVGPRPPTPDEVANYLPWQLRRLALTPGLTCFWQVSGRSEIGFEDWVRLDLRYADSRSPAVDLRTLAKTVPAVLSGRGAF